MSEEFRGVLSQLCHQKHTMLEGGGPGPTGVRECIISLPGLLEQIPQSGWLSTTGIESLTALGAARPKSRCCLKPLGENFSLPLPGIHWVVSHISNLCLHGQTTFSPCVSFLSSLKDQSYWTKGPPYSRMTLSYLITPARTLFPNQVTFGGT